MMKKKIFVIFLSLALIVACITGNMLLSYADFSPAYDYDYDDDELGGDDYEIEFIDATEEKGQLFVYWVPKHGFNEYDVLHYEVSVKYPESDEFVFLKKIASDDEEYQYWVPVEVEDEYGDDEDGWAEMDAYGFDFPVTKRGYYEFRVRACYRDDWEEGEFYTEWVTGGGLYLNMKKPVVKTKTLSSTEVLLSWDPVEGASDYIVYRAKSLKGKYYEMGTVNEFFPGEEVSTYWIDEGLPNRTYYYYVVPAAKYVGFLHHGTPSKTVTGTTGVLKSKISSISSSAKKVTIRWKKDVTASGYEIYRSTSPSSGYKKIATIKSSSKTSYTDTKKAPGKKYYYKVRAYKIIDGKKITGPYSNRKSITVKK